jgi:hypothetical protein
MQHHSNDNREPAGHASGFLRDCASGNGPPPRTRTLLRRFLALVLTSGALAAGGSNAAHSQVRVDGQPEAVHIEALDVPLREVFDALLQAKFNLRYRTGDGLDTRMTGTFNGPLRRVAARMLDGYDFAMKITPQGIDVLVLGQNKPDDKPGAAAAPARTMPEGSPAPVMTAAEANRCERRLAR